MVIMNALKAGKIEATKMGLKSSRRYKAYPSPPKSCMSFACIGAVKGVCFWPGRSETPAAGRAVMVSIHSKQFNSVEYDPY